MVDQPQTAVDRAGNTYITGAVSGTTTFGSTTIVGDILHSNVFLAKLDNAGNYVWAISSLTSGNTGTAVAVDSLGNVYVTGQFGGCMNFGGANLCSSTFSGEGIFVVKFNSNGVFIWGAQGGNTFLTSAPQDMKVDKRGNVYIVGENATAIPGSVATSMRFGAHTVSGQAGRLYVAKLSPRGQWLWAAGAEGNYGFHLAVDKESNAYVAGFFAGPTARFGSTVLTTNTGRGYKGADIFTAKLDSAGRWLWAVQSISGGNWPVGTSSPERVLGGIAVDGNGNAYLGGTASAGSDMGFGTHRTARLGSVITPDGFVAKLNSQGQWLWVKTLVDAPAAAVTTDWLNNVYVAGNNYGDSIRFGSSVLTTTTNGYVAKCFASGTWLWGVGSVNNFVSNIHADEGGNITLSGAFNNGSTFGSTTLLRPSTIRGNNTSGYVARLTGDKLTSQQLLCPGGSVALAGLPGTQAWAWSTGATTPTITVSRPGQYRVVSTYPNGDNLSLEYEVALAPPVSLAFTLGRDTTICSDEKLVLRAPANAPDGVTYRWSDNSADTLLQVQAPGLYWLEASSQCTTYRAQILVGTRECLQLPNIITPNHDGRNDTFRPRGLGTGPWEIKLYNRWGTRVYEAPAYTGEWGADAPAGLYYYQLRQAASQRVYKGWVEVVR